jgi:hypothetical protein
MSVVRYTLLADGSSDNRLIPVLNWLMRQFLLGRFIEPQWANLPLRRRVRLADRIHSALLDFPSHILFVHRDAEGLSREDRFAEIRSNILAAEADAATIIPVIPVRMSEAWFLIDEAAIRAASGNPNGSVRLEMPRLKELESLPNPKTILRDLLKTASELQGRRLQKFNADRACLYIADYIDDFGPLRNLNAFQALERDVSKVCNDRGWDQPDEESSATDSGVAPAGSQNSSTLRP